MIYSIVCAKKIIYVVGKEIRADAGTTKEANVDKTEIDNSRIMSLKIIDTIEHSYVCDTIQNQE